jgi:1,4-alpha-glucan branching enzyme
MLKKRFFKTKDEAEVTFEYSGNGAENVAIVGEFNDWEPVEMDFVKRDEAFRARVRLPKGENFQFRYLLDGESWANDDEADDYVGNEFGSKNSVVSTIE